MSIVNLVLVNVSLKASFMKTYSTGDIAKICDVNQRTVIRWIQRGSLSGFKLPGRGNNRVSRNDLIMFLNQYNFPLPSELKKYAAAQILIADEEKAVANAIQRVFRGCGYTTKLALNGFDLAKEILSRRPQLMTLDFNMSSLNGPEVVNFIRHDLGDNDLKILVISAESEFEASSEQLAFVDGFLAKPFSNESLLAVTQELLPNNSENLNQGQDHG